MGAYWSISVVLKKGFVQGACELELVRSGLDDTMRAAMQAMRALWHSDQNVTDLRIAAYLVAIRKVAESYQTKGL
jgi:glutamate dehydrogenase (NAD(P)+)